MKSNFSEYIFEKTRAELKSEASKSYFSYLWWVLEPAMLLAVFYFVFGVLFQRGGEDFAPFLLVGIVCWLWFVRSTTHCVDSIYGERQLILQVYVPKEVFPLIVIVVGLFKQVFIFGLLLCSLLFISGVKQTWVYLPVLLFVELLFISAVGFAVAAFVPFVPDLKFVIEPALQMMMFCSGVFFNVSDLPYSLQKYFLVNPMAHIIAEFRVVLLDGGEPNLAVLSVIGVVSVVVIFAVLLFIRKNDRLYPKLVL